MPVLVNVSTWDALSFAAFLIIYISTGLVLLGSIIGVVINGKETPAHHFFSLRKSPVAADKMAEDFVTACSQLKSAELAQGMTGWNQPECDAVAKALETLRAMGSVSSS